MNSMIRLKTNLKDDFQRVTVNFNQNKPYKFPINLP